MSKSSTSSRISLGQIKQIEIQPSLVNSWLAKNKSALSVEKEKTNTSSDCSRPWG